MLKRLFYKYILGREYFTGIDIESKGLGNDKSLGKKICFVRGYKDRKGDIHITEQWEEEL